MKYVQKGLLKLVQVINIPMIINYNLFCTILSIIPTKKLSLFNSDDNKVLSKLLVDLLNLSDKFIIIESLEDFRKKCKVQYSYAKYYKN